MKIFKLFLFNTILGGLLATNASAQIQSLQSAGRATCFGTNVTSRNAGHFIDEIVEERNSMLGIAMFNVAIGRFSESHYQETMDRLDESILKLEAIMTGSDSVFNRQQLVGTEICKPAYKCTSVNGNPRSMQGANSCADCADTKNDGTCVTGCNACCAHFGATECGCDSDC